MANEKTDQEKAAEKLAADKAAADKKAAEEKKPALANDFTINDNGDILTGNLTRDSIAVQLRGKFTEEGKSQDEATKLAVKRAYEMVRG